MISKAKMSLVRSLEQKKYRQIEQLYLAEGTKLVEEAIRFAPDQIVEILALPNWIERHVDWVRQFNDRTTEISEKELERSTLLRTPNEVMCLLRLPQTVSQPTLQYGKFYLVLDNLQDPGNLGTMLRIADWFGFSQVIASPNSVDVFNPKVVQSSMGSIFRTPIVYTDLEALLLTNQQAPKPLPVWAAALGGQDAWTLDNPATAQSGGLLLIGSESHGLRPELLALASQKIAIPAYGHAESLNAAMAASVLCSILRRHS